jgi:ABC-type glycerol-3-phosphate transport system substrate-binding protein
MMELTKPISRRAVVAGAMAAAAGLAADSIVPTGSRARSMDADVVTLTYQTAPDVETDKLFRMRLADFAVAHPSIKINYQPRPNATWENIEIPTRARSGTLPDIIQGSTFSTAYWANQGWLLPLDPYLQAAKMGVNDFWPAEVAQMSWKGKLYALPFDWSNLGIAFNKTLFDKKGIKYPPFDGSWTWNDLHNLGKEFVEISGGSQSSWGIDISPITYTWTTAGFVLAWGGKWVSQDLRSFNVDTPEAVKLFQFMQDMVFKDKVAVRAGSLPAGFDPFASGKMAMTIAGSWSALPFRATIGTRFGWDVVPLPKGPTGRIPISAAGSNISIAATSKHPQEAFQFLNYWTSTASEEILISRPLRSLPGRQSAVPAWTQEARTNNLPPAHAAVFPNEMRQAFNVPMVPYWNEFATLAGTYINNMIVSDKPVAASLAQWQSAVQTAIGKYKF